MRPLSRFRRLPLRSKLMLLLTLLLFGLLWPKVDWLLWRPRALLLDMAVMRGQRAEIRWDRADRPVPGWGSVFYLGQGEHQIEIAPSKPGKEVRLLGAASDDEPWLNLRDLPPSPGWVQVAQAADYGNVGLRVEKPGGPLSFRMRGSRIALAFAATPMSGLTRVTIDGQSHAVDLADPAATGHNRVYRFTPMPGKENSCRVVLPFGRKKTIRLTSVPGDADLRLHLSRIGWAEGRDTSTLNAHSVRALGSATASQDGDGLVISIPDASGWIEFPDLVKGATPSFLLQAAVGVLLLAFVYLVVHTIAFFWHRFQAAPPWEPQPVPMIERRIVLIIALAVHVLVFLSASPLIFFDSTNLYIPAARRVLYEWTLVPATFHQFIGPGYPAFMAIINRIVGDASGLIFAQHLLMALACYFAWFLVRERSGPVMSGIVAATAIFCPYLLAFPSFVLTEGLYVSLYMIVIFLATRRPRFTWLHAAFLGAMVGITVLVRTQGLLLLPFVLVLAWVLVWPRRQLAHAAVAGVVLLAVLAPVSAFNARRGYIAPASGSGRQIFYMAGIHSLLDWSLPELVLAAGMREEMWVGGFFHPLRRPAAERRYESFGYTLVGLGPAAASADFTDDDHLKGQIAYLSVTRDAPGYLRAVLRSATVLGEVEDRFYDREAAWFTLQFVDPLVGSQLGQTGAPEPCGTPSLTARIVQALAQHLFLPGLLFWLMVGGALAIPTALLGDRRDPVAACLAFLGTAYLLSLALMLVSISRYAVAVYLPLLGATALALAQWGRWAWALWRDRNWPRPGLSQTREPARGGPGRSRKGAGRSKGGLSASSRDRCSVAE